MTETKYKTVLDELQAAYDQTILVVSELSNVLERVHEEINLSPLIDKDRINDINVSERIKLTKTVLGIASLTEEEEGANDD